jgi:hypothetical protein
MPMKPYPVLCYTPGCGAAAQFKIAAKWSDGVTSELKTYSLCCEKCLAKGFTEAKRRQAICPLALDETLEAPNIFEMAAGSLNRRAELEV